MKTKTFILQTLFCVIIFSAHAQKPKPSFTISAGISSAMYSSDDDFDESSSSDLRTGANAGITLRLPTGKHWAVEPGLFYVQKGGVEKITDGGDNSIKFTTSLNYLELPVNMFYSKRNRFFWGFGPSFGLGLSGKIKAEEESQKVKFGSDGDLKSFEIGVGGMGGFQFRSNIFIALNINSGLNDLSTDDSYEFMNGYMGIRLGYVFAKK